MERSESRRDKTDFKHSTHLRALLLRTKTDGLTGLPNFSVMAVRDARQDS